MIKSFNGLRFLAALSVFLVHVPFTSSSNFITENLFNNAGFAVTFFFILSGFCITLGYQNKFESVTRDNFLLFMKKRIVKLYPLYLFTTLWAFIFNICTHSDLKGILHFTACLPVALTMTQTLTIYKPGMLNGASWFMATIVVCYLATPHILCRLKNISVRNTVLGIAACYALVSAICILGKGIPQPYQLNILYTSPYVRIFYYVIGILLAKLYTSQNLENTLSKSKGLLLETAAVVVGLAAYLSGAYLGMDYTDQLINIAYIPCISFCIFAFAKSSAGKSESIIGKFLGSKVMTTLGNISLDIYLLHYVVIFFGGQQILERINPTGTTSNVLYLFLGTLILAVGWNLLWNAIVSHAKSGNRK